MAAPVKAAATTNASRPIVIVAPILKPSLRQTLRSAPRLSYKRGMAETTYFPRRLILGGAVMTGVLLALAVHMLGARYGLDLGGLWRSDTRDFMPAGAAIAWWLTATGGFPGG